MRLVIEAGVREKFEICVGIAEIRGVMQKRSDEISKEIADVAAEIKSRYNIDEVKEIRTIRMQRDFFWRMGIDPTKVRPASEALLRRILLNKGLPRVSPIVDAYNLASVERHCLPSALLTWSE